MSGRARSAARRMPEAWEPIVDGLTERSRPAPRGFEAPDPEDEVRRVLRAMRREEVQALLIRAVEERTYQELGDRLGGVTRDQVRQLIVRGLREARRAESAAFLRLQTWYAPRAERADWSLLVPPERLPWVRIALHLATGSSERRAALFHLEGDLWHGTPSTRWRETVARAQACFTRPEYLPRRVFVERTGLVLSPALTHPERGPVALTREGRVGLRSWTGPERMEALCRRLREAGHRRWRLDALAASLARLHGPDWGARAALDVIVGGRVFAATGTAGEWQLAEDAPPPAPKPRVEPFRLDLEARAERLRPDLEARAERFRLDLEARAERVAREGARVRAALLEEARTSPELLRPRSWASKEARRAARSKKVAGIRLLLAGYRVPLHISAIHARLPGLGTRSMARRLISEQFRCVRPGYYGLPEVDYVADPDEEAWILSHLGSLGRAPLGALLSRAGDEGRDPLVVTGTCVLSERLRLGRGAVWDPGRRDARSERRRRDQEARAALRQRVRDVLEAWPVPLAARDVFELLPPPCDRALLNRVLARDFTSHARGVYGLPGRAYEVDPELERWLLEQLELGYRARIEALHAAADAAGLARPLVLGTCVLSERLELSHGFVRIAGWKRPVRSRSPQLKAVQPPARA